MHFLSPFLFTVLAAKKEIHLFMQGGFVSKK